jgi:tetratricopeptide (TPR) repeat protein
MHSSKNFLVFFVVFLLPSLSVSAQSPSDPKPAIIRDTDIAEGIEEVEPEKERNPAEAEENIDIGDFYYKQKNFVGAITRYLTAIEYEPDSDRAYKSVDKAYKSLVKAYTSLDRTPESRGRAEKRYGVIPIAIAALKDFLSKNPDSIKGDDYQEMIAKLDEIYSQFSH